MTIAEIHGKSPYSTSEDFLTADVFTAFRYLPAETGIVGFLRTVRGLAALIPPPEETVRASFFFWPLGASREPDVLIELVIDGHLYHVVVEAKYLSGPSDRELVEVEADGDVTVWGNQLADQMRELLAGSYTMWQEGVRHQGKMLQSEPSCRALLYLTAHPLPPQEELARARGSCPEGEAQLFWTSWYDVDSYLRAQREAFSAFPYSRIVDDLLTLLALKGFAAFRGVRRPPALQSPRAAFWRGRRRLLPRFDGVRHPPTLLEQQPSGHFWSGER